MSQTLLWAVCLSLLRSFTVASVCVLSANAALPILRCSTLMRRLAWGLLLPVIMPPLVMGYAYSNVALSLIREPLLNDLLYSLLLVMRFFPVALLILYLSPAPLLTPTALHNLKLAKLSRWQGYLTHGDGRLQLITFAVLFILSFTEFEITSRMGCTSWTIWLFDAQVGGTPLSQTLIWLSLPTSISLLILAAVFIALPRHRESQKPCTRPMRTIATTRWVLLIIWWLASLLLCIIIPWWWVLTPAIKALPAVLREMQILSEIGYSLLFATLGGLAALLITLISDYLPRWMRWLLCLPGLAGSLVVGLVILGIFQLPIFHSLYDTPIPIVLSLLIIALPAGLILGPILIQHSSSMHLGQLAGLSTATEHQKLAKHLRWQYQNRQRWMLLCILMFVTYYDLPASALLAPPGMSPAVVRLYNLMHYGQYETLSAMVLLTYALPAMGLAFLFLIASMHGRLTQGKSTTS
ncbi:MAG: hypothetical protein JKX85_00385 [Phycisphaeraceae bacterium]|nr:hypothetical protein [Phycisphaeraceae bacterium]